MSGEATFVGFLLSCAFIGVLVALFGLTGNSTRSNIAQDCDRHGAFYVGDTRYECRKAQ